MRVCSDGSLLVRSVRVLAVQHNSSTQPELGLRQIHPYDCAGHQVLRMAHASRRGEHPRPSLTCASRTRMHDWLTVTWPHTSLPHGWGFACFPQHRRTHGHASTGLSARSLSTSTHHRCCCSRAAWAATQRIPQHACPRSSRSSPPYTPHSHRHRHHHKAGTATVTVTGARLRAPSSTSRARCTSQNVPACDGVACNPMQCARPYASNATQCHSHSSAPQLGAPRARLA